MLVWFVTIGGLGLVEIVHSPWILGAVNPMHAVRFIGEHGMGAFFVLGSVVLVITGGEALYADMGHFGRRPIRLAWLIAVFPALLLNYFGQGAMLVRNPGAADNPFYQLAPKVMLIPLIVLATCAAIVASQAMISGAFSVTRQGIQLGFIPRLEIRHTSKTEEGQIYIPEVNWFIAVGCLIIVIAFQNTSRLGAAYGIAVTGTMLITTMLFYVVARLRFRWTAWQAGSLTPCFWWWDVSFFSANIVKVAHGGWVPLVLGAALFVGMLTWKRGRALLSSRLARAVCPSVVSRWRRAVLGASRCRNGGFHDGQRRRRAARAAAPPQAQQGAARARAACLGQDGGCTRNECLGTCARGATWSGLLACDCLVRVHAVTECPAGARGGGPDGHPVQTHGNELFPGSRAGSFHSRPARRSVRTRAVAKGAASIMSRNARSATEFSPFRRIVSSNWVRRSNSDNRRDETPNLVVPRGHLMLFIKWSRFR
jgi:hypothetical protein